MAFPLPNQIVATFQVGDKTMVVFDHVGPLSYVQATGDVINAADLGFGGFEFMDFLPDTTATFVSYPILELGGYGNAVPHATVHWWALVTGTKGGQSQTLGTEAAASTNLSTFSARFRALCV